MMQLTIVLVACLCCCLQLLAGQAQARVGVGAGEQEWGYVTVRPGAHMFWWLYFNTDASTNYTAKPLLIWLQGGPGAASSGYGNFHELGPYDVRLNYRNDTWVKDYNVLFIDNPVGTGFSYAEDSSGFARDNARIAKDLLELMRGFYSKLPQFRKLPVYVISESYGGKMAAEFALVWHKAEKSGAIESKLRGVGLGDSWISPIDSVLTWAPFLLQTGMVDTRGFEQIQRLANQTARAVALAQWTRATNLWAATENLILQVTGNIDFYNILSKVQAARNWPNRAYPLDDLPALARVTMRKSADLDEIALDALMNSKVRSALKLNATWGSQSGKVFSLLYEDFMKPVTRIVERLLDETDLRVFVYTGQLDLIVDTPGTLLWVENMTWSYSKLWQASRRSPLLANGLIEGYRKTCKNFGFYWINRAGHMVPADNPAATAVLLEELTSN